MQERGTGWRERSSIQAPKARCESVVGARGFRDTRRGLFLATGHRGSLRLPWIVGSEHPPLNGHGLNGKSLEIFQKAFKRLCDRYDQRLISNDIRSCYVEFMIATILGEGWRVVSADWAG
jgi:hypothetical protein